MKLVAARRLRSVAVTALALSLACALSFDSPAHAQGGFRAPRSAASFQVRAYIGCSIDPRHYLSIRNTTSGVLGLGTPVYWSGKQEGQPPHEYSAPLYANVSPGGLYQIGGAYRYDPSVACQAWVMRPAVATRAP